MSKIQIVGHHQNIRIENIAVIGDQMDVQRRAIPKGKPGSSRQLPITVGTIHVNPGPDETINVYVISSDIPLKRGSAPRYTITYGHIYILDGPDLVQIVFPEHVSGTVNIQIVQK